MRKNMAKKKLKKPIKRRLDLERPYNSGTWTKSRFFGFIRSALRSASSRWQPKFDCLKAAYVDTRINTKTNRASKHYKCAICKGVFPGKEVQVDHIIPAGRLADFNDLPSFAERLFCEAHGFRALCITCHQQVTAEEKLRVANSSKDTQDS
jgi:hypothetical protein